MDQPWFEKKLLACVAYGMGQKKLVDSATSSFESDLRLPVPTYKAVIQGGGYNDTLYSFNCYDRSSRLLLYIYPASFDESFRRRLNKAIESSFDLGLVKITYHFIIKGDSINRKL